MKAGRAGADDFVHAAGRLRIGRVALLEDPGELDLLRIDVGDRDPAGARRARRRCQPRTSRRSSARPDSPPTAAWLRSRATSSGRCRPRRGTRPAAARGRRPRARVAALRTDPPSSAPRPTRFASAAPTCDVDLAKLRALARVEHHRAATARRGSSAGRRSSTRCLRGGRRRACPRAIERRLRRLRRSAARQTARAARSARRCARERARAKSSEMPNDRTICHEPLRVDAPQRVAVRGEHLARHIDRC